MAQANSGAGKSWICRRIIELVAKHLPVIILDWEGEFHTLREKYDFLLVGGEDADCPVSVRGASLLARRIMEHDISAIIRIDELKKHQRFEFVRRFLDAMVESPRKLWRPRLVIVDEAHELAPEKGKAASTGAVIDLMARGRKRGLCGLLATQRIGKIHKDAIAEANNKFIGRAALDIDMKRAGDELGLNTKEQRLALRTLKPGEFYVFGPAVSEQVRKIKIGPVKTTHPKAGQRLAPVVPARNKVRKLIQEMGDIPADAEQEIQDLAEAKAKIRSLNAELRKKTGAKEAHGQQISAKQPPPAEVDYAALETRWWGIAVQDMEKLVEEQRKALEGLTRLFDGYQGHARTLSEELAAGRGMVMDAVKRLRVPRQPKVPKRSYAEKKAVAVDGLQRQERHLDNAVQKLARYGRPVAEVKKAIEGNGDLSLRSGLGRILAVLVQRFPAKMSIPQVATLAKMKGTGGTFKTYWSRLKVAGLIESDGLLWTASDAGIDKFGGQVPNPQTQDEVVDMWAQAVGGKAGDMLRLLVERYPGHYTRDELAAETGLEVNGGTYKTYISRLRANNLAITDAYNVKASDDLMS